MLRPCCSKSWENWSISLAARCLVLTRIESLSNPADWTIIAVYDVTALITTPCADAREDQWTCGSDILPHPCLRCGLVFSAIRMSRAETICRPASGGKANSGRRWPFRRGSNRGLPIDRATNRFQSAPAPSAAQGGTACRQDKIVAAVPPAMRRCPPKSRATADEATIAADAAAAACHWLCQCPALGHQSTGLRARTVPAEPRAATGRGPRPGVPTGC